MKRNEKSKDATQQPNDQGQPRRGEDGNSTPVTPKDPENTQQQGDPAVGCTALLGCLILQDGDYIQTDEISKQYRNGQILNEPLPKQSTFSFLKRAIFHRIRYWIFDENNEQRPIFYIPENLLRQRFRQYEERSSIR